MSKKNDPENDWDRFDESILLVTNGRRRTVSSGLSPSSCSTHSDQHPQLFTSPPAPLAQPIPVIDQPRAKVPRPPILSAPEDQLSMPKKEELNKNDFSTDCSFCDVPLVNCEPHDPHIEAMFSCAACGVKKHSYEEISRHVQDSHIGDDMELVLASIIVPSSMKMLKEFKCGIKSCGRRFIGRGEEDLKAHIRDTHGPYYINICKGRNLVRLCRICSGCFESDASLTSHILQWHPVSMFANEELNVANKPQPVPPFNIVLREDTIEVKEDKKESRRILTSVLHMDREKISRKRKVSESIKDRLTLTARDDVKRSNKEIPGIEDSQEQIDLKYKLRKVREAKDRSSTKVYCEACCRTTKDWVNHKYGLDHIKNDKKARCHFCPKRFWIGETREHMALHHRGSSFTCNRCGIKLISLDKMTEHINAKHREKVDEVIAHFGQHWESNFVSSNHLGMNNFFLLPSDLRRLSCRVCGMFFLGQDQSVLEEHFRLEHSHVAREKYTENILFECRVCSGVLFGSEAHLLTHFKEVHSEAKLSVEMESDYADSEADLKNVHVYKRNYESRVSKVASSLSELSVKKKEKKQKGTENESDSSNYVERVSNNLKPKKRKLINTFKSNPAMHVKRLYSDYVSQDSISTENASDSETSIVACKFCEMKMKHHHLENHMKKFHKDNLFCCDGSCRHKVYSAWRQNMVSHLRNVHKLTSIDSKLYEKYMKLPVNLAVISCKSKNCSEEAIFLARDVDTVEKMLKRHAEKRHRGMRIEECYNLGCRVCSLVWRLDDIQDWSDHCRAHHGLLTPEKIETEAASRQKTHKLLEANPIDSKSESIGFGRQLSVSMRLKSDVNSNEPKAATFPVSLIKGEFCIQYKNYLLLFNLH